MNLDKSRRIEESLFQIELELKKIKVLVDVVDHEFFGRDNPKESLQQFSRYRLFSSMIVDHMVCVQELLEKVPCPGWKEENEF